MEAEHGGLRLRRAAHRDCSRLDVCRFLNENCRKIDVASLTAAMIGKCTATCWEYRMLRVSTHAAWSAVTPSFVVDRASNPKLCTSSSTSERDSCFTINVASLSMLIGRCPAHATSILSTGGKDHVYRRKVFKKIDSSARV